MIRKISCMQWKRDVSTDIVGRDGIKKNICKKVYGDIETKIGKKKKKRKETKRKGERTKKEKKSSIFNCWVWNYSFLRKSLY